MQIYTQIAKVMAEVGAVGKDSTNPQQKYKYRGIDAVMNALHPAMVNNHIFVVPEVLEQVREERTSKQGGLLIYSVCKIKHKFFAEDGSFVEATVIGEGMDSGDKATNKAMSVAFKYACFQVFCIPTEEMIDSEVDSPEPRMKVPAMVTKLTDANKNEKISAEDFDKAQHFITDFKVLAYILKSYGKESLADLTNVQYFSILNHYEEYVQKANAQ